MLKVKEVKPGLWVREMTARLAMDYYALRAELEVDGVAADGGEDTAQLPPETRLELMRARRRKMALVLNGCVCTPDGTPVYDEAGPGALDSMSMTDAAEAFAAALELSFEGETEDEQEKKSAAAPA